MCSREDVNERVRTGVVLLVFLVEAAYNFGPDAAGVAELNGERCCVS